MDGRDHVRRAIRHYLEKDDDLREDPGDQARLDASIQAAFLLARAAVSAARDVRDMVLHLPPYLEGRPSAVHRHYDAVWTFLEALWELIDYCEKEQDVASSDVEDPVWFFGRALDQHLGGNPFEALTLLDEAGLTSTTQDSWVQMLRAEALAATGQQVEAIAAWEAATTLDPLLVQAHVSAAGELEALGRDGEAYAHWLAVRRTVPRETPLSGEAKRHLARLRHRLKAESEAQKAEPFERLPRWGPSWVPAWPGMGRPHAGARTLAPLEAPPPGAAAADPSGSEPEPAVSSLQPFLGLAGRREGELTVYVAGADPTSEGVIKSKSAVYLGGGRLVGSGLPAADTVEREEPDVVVLASGVSAEQCAAMAERASAGTLKGSAGPTSFIYNGPAEAATDLGVIFDGLGLELLPDINPPAPDPDEDCDEPDGAAATVPDPLAATVAAVEKRVRLRLDGKPSPRIVVARGAIGLVPALTWLDGGEGRYGGRVPPWDLISVSAESHGVEAVVVRGGQAAGHSFIPDGEDRGRLLEDLFEEMPRVLPPGDTALLLARLLGEDGPIALSEGPEAFVAATLTAGVVSRALLGLREVVAAETSYATRSNHVLVGGSLISRLPTPEHALLAAIDGCQPTGVTRVLLDPYGIVTALGDGLVSGRLAPDAPSMADGAASLLAGSCLCVAPLVQGVNWGKPGRKPILAATVKGAWRDGERTWQLYRGEIIWVPLPAGRRIELAIRPSPSYNVGRGRGAEWRGEFVAGGMGLILDGRGRPLRLPADETSRTTLRAVWASELIGRARGA